MDQKSLKIKEKFAMVWRAMINRCSSPLALSWHSYGGRGIKVCKRWLQYKNFEKDMYEEYKKYFENIGDIFKLNRTFTLDRIDNNKGYSRENCRWVDMSVQYKNRKR